jgi:predicted AAA+ superfamily ATPase
MFSRQLQPVIESRLHHAPAVVLLGPRQVGKTTLARTLASQFPGALLMDLERESDRAALLRPELFLPQHRSSLLKPVRRRVCAP